MDTIADDGLCSNAGDVHDASFGAPSLRPLWPKVSPVFWACPKPTGKACFGCQQGRSKTDFLSQTAQNRLELASAPKHLKPDIAKVDFGRKPVVPSVRL